MVFGIAVLLSGGHKSRYNKALHTTVFCAFAFVQNRTNTNPRHTACELGVSTYLMSVHSPYELAKDRGPDFIVEYEIDLCDELKDAKPGQGMRVDFLYDGDSPSVEGVHMIWPEILDKNGSVQIDTTPGAIRKNGYANMWVVNEDMRSYHKERVKVGTKGTWWRGGRIANVKVIQIVGLLC